MESPPMTSIMFEESKPPLAEGSAAARYIASIPPHIEETPWLEFGFARASDLCDAISLELEPLTGKQSAKRVHSSRITLRRWFSVWAVLKQDKWESDPIRKKVIKRLRKLLKLLGSLRDWDVNLEMGATFGCPPEILSEWRAKRKSVKKEVKSQIDRLDVAALLMRLRNYLHNHHEKLRTRDIATTDKPVSTFARLDAAVTKQEERVKELEASANTPEDLHRLRLAIKRWRYLLTEFFGLTNLELVKAQQILGKLNDYERLDTLLTSRQVPDVTEKIKVQREQLMAEFSQLRGALPYGLRPLMVSVAEQSGADAPALAQVSKNISAEIPTLVNILDEPAILDQPVDVELEDEEPEDDDLAEDKHTVISISELPIDDRTGTL